MTHSRIRIQNSNYIARLLPTSSPKRFVANERDEIRNETKLFLGNAPAFIFLLSFTIPPRKERAEREREREREREKRYSAQKEVQSSLRRIARAVKFKIFLSLGHNIIAEVHVSFSFSFSLSLSLSLYLLCIQKELSRGHRDTKKNAPSLSLFLLAQTVSLNHISIYHGIDDMLCIVIIAISAGSRVLARVFSAPEKRAFRARNLFFFVSLSREMFGSTSVSRYFFV